jgi:nickel-dependent lactate racemase
MGLFAAEVAEMVGAARAVLPTATDGHAEGLAEVGLSAEQLGRVLQGLVQSYPFENKRVLLIVPDNTRTAPIGRLFRALHARLAKLVRRLDVLIALGTHPPLDERAILERLELSAEERAGVFSDVQIYNHAFTDAAELAQIGCIAESEIYALSEGRFALPVPVQINRRVLEYDTLLVVGPVFPHEVVGFSGGNKYFFPGVSGPEILNFFHWLGAMVTNPMIIGSKHTPVRRVVDRAAALIPKDRLCLAAVVHAKVLAGLYAGTPEAAWEAASDLSAWLHITYKPRPFSKVLSCAPAMYDELWVAGKCMYKLEPVVADGGELIIYAPHLREISRVHGHFILQLGYHCRDYFLKQWERFSAYPWGVLAHSTHVHGLGTYEDGVETRRVRVTLASGIPEAVCETLNLGYRAPDSIRYADYLDREAEGVLVVPRAGEQLFHLRNRPRWAGGNAVAPAPVSAED